MSDVEKLLFCKTALADIGTRSTLPDLVTDTTETFYCNLYYPQVRDQLLRAAYWNFATKETLLSLWKAVPGTPENNTNETRVGWLGMYPKPPWLYSYLTPTPSLVAPQMIVGYPSVGAPMLDDVPIFSGLNRTGIIGPRAIPMPFEIGTDDIDPVGHPLNITSGISAILAPLTGTGYRPNDYVTLVGGAFGVPAVVYIGSVTALGEPILNGLRIARQGTYVGTVPAILTQASTTGTGEGFSCGRDIQASPNAVKVLLTNQGGAVLTFTDNSLDETLWDPGFVSGFQAALSARLALALTGDKVLARDKFQIANNAIMEARVANANEGMVVWDPVPDWLAIRGAGWNNPTTSPYYYPYGELFPV